MKRILLVATLMFLFSNIIFSQIKFGLTIGGNYSGLTHKVKKDIDLVSDYDIGNYSYTFGLRFGFNIDIPIVEDVFSIQPALLYSQKGYGISVRGLLNDDPIIDSVDGSINVSYNYIELPIDLVFKIQDIRITIGSYIAYGINGKEVADFTVYDDAGRKLLHHEWDFDVSAVNGTVDEETFINEHTEGNTTDFFNSFDYGLNFGIGYVFYEDMVVNAGYSLGLTNVVPNYDVSKQNSDGYNLDNYSENVVMKNSVFSLSFTYFF